MLFLLFLFTTEILQSMSATQVFYSSQEASRTSYNICSLFTLQFCAILSRRADCGLMPDLSVHVCARVCVKVYFAI